MKIYLGRDTCGDRLWLEKHKWDCGWYWAFGYIGNPSLHTHISSLIDYPKEYDPKWTNVSRQFCETWITQDQWWIIRDLFISAYTFKKAAEVYRYGGHQTHSAEKYRITSDDMAAKLNGDLARLLDNIWGYITTNAPRHLKNAV